MYHFTGQLYAYMNFPKWWCSKLNGDGDDGRDGVCDALQIKVDAWCLLSNPKNDDLENNGIFEVRIWTD